ncbi:hypothetical protein PAGA_a1730 [Pseudoalteromonas agarivorans DSM 14585]|uniref:Uncharacterized protein n=1 Tax=Pseudoalteromonas agarivorans DSM 14585 TaxID=1312369 RepID=A0ACA8DVL2_9GAMM|nr:hypothetical protein PAGA_a1730 [Pseudoalteromonas agarivorans DSM 14585]
MANNLALTWGCVLSHMNFPMLSIIHIFSVRFMHQRNRITNK